MSARTVNQWNSLFPWSLHLEIRSPRDVIIVRGIQSFLEKEEWKNGHRKFQLLFTAAKRGNSEDFKDTTQERRYLVSV